MSLSSLQKNKLGAWINTDTLIQSLLIIFAFFILLQVSPYRQPVPATDSGIFLYIGDQILDGKLPYVDAWDHKGPIIFYLNALGLMIGAGSRWGVWLLEFLFVGAAVLLGYRLMKEILGRYPAIFGSLLWLLHLNLVIDGGNLTEEYGMLFQFATLFFFWRSTKSKNLRNEFLAGFFAALAFWLRANIIAIPITIGLYWLWQAWREKDAFYWKRIGALLAGGLTLSALIIAYFWLNGALAGLWDGSFYYNAIYSSSTLKQQWNSVVAGFRLLPVVFSMALAGWLIAISILRRKEDDNLRTVAFIVAIAFPLEIIFAGISGRGFRHYFMSWLPIFGLTAAFFLAYLIKLVGSSKKSEDSDLHIRPLAISFIIALSFLPVLRLWPRALASVDAFVQAGGLPEVDISDSSYAPAIDFIEKNIEEGGEVIFWGKVLGINWLSNRAVPSRHIFQDHFFTEDYVSEDMIEEYIQDIENSRAIIIDTLAGRESYPPVGTDLELLPESVRPLYSYLADHYQVKEILRPKGWVVYEYIESVHE